VTEINVVKLDESHPAALFTPCYTDNGFDPMGVAVSLDLRDGEFTVRTTRPPQDNAIPASVQNGAVRWYPVPLITAHQANALLDELRPVAERVLSGSGVAWDGNNDVGRLDKAADEADVELFRFVEQFTQDNAYSRVEVWEAADFFAEGDQLEQITGDMSDDELAAKGEEFRADFEPSTPGGHVVVVDMIEFLESVRDEKRAG
jgi:hypothetical protein